MNFSMKLADVSMHVEVQFPSTLDFCRPYLTQEPPQAEIVITSRDIAREREIGQGRGSDSDACLEALALQRKVTQALFEKDILLFHGSALALDGRGCLFTANSGTGKSTHARLWREAFGPRVVMINDDKPFLAVTAQGVTLWGSPWNGKHRLGTNASAPLEAICLLERGQTDIITPISPQEALPMLFQQSWRPGDPARLMRYMDLVDTMTKRLRFYRLQCTLAPEAAQISAGGIFPKGGNL